MRQVLLFAVAALLVITGCRSRAAKPPHVAFDLPAGFAVEAAAPARLLGPIHTFTFDSRGRPVVVAKERGLAVQLLDNNGDGFFETERVLNRAVKNVRGLRLDGRVLYVLGWLGGEYGLYRLEDRNGDGEMENVETLAVLEAPPSTSRPHDMRVGTDGAMMLVDRGRWWRWSEERRALEAVAGGLPVSAAGLILNSDGEAFVPGGTALIHAVPGGQYGEGDSGEWLDTLPAMQPGGEGVGGGLEFYEHDVYPQPLHGVLFQADGVSGRVVARRLGRLGSTYQYAEGPALFAMTPAQPKHVTHLEVGPDGLLYFSVSGPAGQAGFFRLRYQPSWREQWDKWRGSSNAAGVTLVRQAQPRSSWGALRLDRQREFLEAKWADELEELAAKEGAVAEDRVRAVLLLLRTGPKPKPALIKKLMAAKEPRVRAAAMLATSALKGTGTSEVLTVGIHDADPLVRRRAAEAVTSEIGAPEGLYGLLKDSDRFVRFAARAALERVPRETWLPRVMAEQDSAVARAGMLAMLRTAAGAEETAVREAVIEKLLAMLESSQESGQARLDTVRLLVLAARAEVKDAALQRRAADMLLPLFNSGAGEAMDREAARALSWCGGAEGVAKILGAMPRATRGLQLHYARYLREAPKAGWSAANREAMVDWFAGTAGWGERALSGLFDAFAKQILTRAEARQARRRLPHLANGAAQSAEEIFEAQVPEEDGRLAPVGDSKKGQAFFEARCSSCHYERSEVGPDLAEVGTKLKRAEMLEAILWPARGIEERYKAERIELSDGSAIEALILREDTKTLVLRTASEPRAITILKSRVKARQKLETSIMPEGLLDGAEAATVTGLLDWLGEKQEKALK